jgi:hypothetical protein
MSLPYSLFMLLILVYMATLLTSVYVHYYYIIIGYSSQAKSRSGKMRGKMRTSMCISGGHKNQTKSKDMTYDAIIINISIYMNDISGQRMRSSLRKLLS